MCRGANELKNSTEAFTKVHKIFQRLLISNAAFRVLLNLMSCSEGWNPSYKAISQDTGISIREVQRAIKCLIKIGLVRQLTVGCKLKKRTSTYDISNLIENTEKYIGMRSRGRCLQPEPDSEESVNPATPSAVGTIPQRVEPATCLEGYLNRESIQCIVSDKTPARRPA